jgi:hypothetical protein
MRAPAKAKPLGRSRLNPKDVGWESVGTCLPGIGTLRGDGARLRLKRGVDARCAPRWGAGAVDSLDSRRGVSSRLALVAPPRPPSTGERTG